MSKILQFALIGCKRIAKSHVAPLTELTNAKLVALCDLVPEKAQDHADKHGLPVYTNYHAMLFKEEVDVI